VAVKLRGMNMMLAAVSSAISMHPPRTLPVHP
jgi:hypothetical protein